MRQSTTAVLWGVFTVTAVATGLGAVGVVRDAVTPPAASALSPEQVTAELASATLTTTSSPGPSATSGRSPSSDPSPSRSSHPGATHVSSPTPAPSSSPSATTAGTRPTQAPTTSPSSGGKQSTDATSVTRSLGSRGGSVVATCSAGSVYLKSWSPAPGFRVHEVQRGPASDVEVTFESGALEVQMHVRCVSGVPVAVSEASGEDAGAESVED